MKDRCNYIRRIGSSNSGQDQHWSTLVRRFQELFQLLSIENEAQATQPILTVETR